MCKVIRGGDGIIGEIKGEVFWKCALIREEGLQSCDIVLCLMELLLQMFQSIVGNIEREGQKRVHSLKACIKQWFMDASCHDRLVQHILQRFEHVLPSSLIPLFLLEGLDISLAKVLYQWMLVHT